LKLFALVSLFIFSLALNAQKHLYDVELFGKKIGSTTVERIDKGDGVVEYKLESHSEVNILFTKKTSVMNMDAVYKNGQMISSYVKNVKDDVTEIVTIAWDGARYIIKKGQETLQLKQAVDFSNSLLYFIEPVGRQRIFSERLGQFCGFKTVSTGVYECKLDNGVDNIYRYKNGLLYELEMSKGASVFMKLVK
jgi:uncharacterized protein DUF6134